MITSWNNGATRLYGYSAEEAIGRHVELRLSRRAADDDVDSILRQVREGRAVERLETASVRKDGSRRRRVGHVLADSRLGGHASSACRRSARDITQLVRARQEIAEREERIRLLLDSTAEAIYGIDLSGVCIFCNAACARLLGYDSPAALIGKQMHPLIHHTRRRRHAVPARAVADLRGDAPPRGGARRRRSAVARRRHVASRRSTGAIRSSGTTR